MSSDSVPLRTIRTINSLPAEQKHAVYRRLIPSTLLKSLGIDPIMLVDSLGRTRVEFESSAGTGLFKLRVRGTDESRDNALYVEMADTLFSQIEVLLLVINDLRSDRYDVDRDAAGDPTKFGLMKRNREEEERAMKAGLAPGQVRPGLRLLRPLVLYMEDFVATLGHDSWFLSPLGYHNAVLFERYGFGYVTGRAKMEWIDREFLPDGSLFKALDGSTPFRCPQAARTVRCRSWAIHDGILGEPWGGVRMYKKVGHDAGVRTVSADVGY